eukprot:gb/GECG01014360.1/.p1 GENE.gb/GECG01014360.1/~~gb/GECG01014360.1/.p1  ORF type:complete len:125 (+),score=9.03 gb/GECG01014360.1/:1-375(+)
MACSRETSCWVEWGSKDIITSADAPTEGLWEKRDGPIGESEWYSSWGGLDMAPLLSTAPNITSKRRPDKDGHDYFDPLEDSSRLTPFGAMERFFGLDLCKKYGTPDCCKACSICMAVWGLVIYC